MACKCKIKNPLKFTKIYEVKSPTRGTSLSAGIDFYIPDGDDRFINDLLLKNEWLRKNKNCLLTENVADGYEVYSYTAIKIPSHQDILIPSGIHVNIPDNLALIAYNKSGVATKKHLDIGAAVVDNDYQGQIHIHINNTSKEDVVVGFGEKIIQFILIPVEYSQIEEVETLEQLYPEKSDRGHGGFGSTGTK